MKKTWIKTILLMLCMVCLCMVSACSGSDAFDGDGSGFGGSADKESHVSGNETNAGEETSASKPQKDFWLSVYSGYNFELCVNADGNIVYAEYYWDELTEAEGPDLTGLPLEEGLRQVWDTMYEHDLFSSVEFLEFYFVLHESLADHRWIENLMVIPTSEYLASKGLSHIQVGSGVCEYIKDSSSPEYAFYEKHYPKSTAEIKDSIEYYDELTRTGDAGEEYRRLLAMNQDSKMPFEVAFEHDGYRVSILYDANGKVGNVILNAETISITLTPLAGADVYKANCLVYSEKESAVFWPDGKVDTFYGYGALDVKIPGSFESGRLYLPGAALDDYEEAKALMEQYDDSCVTKGEYEDILYLDLGEGALAMILSFHEEDRLSICKYSSDGRETETMDYMARQLYAVRKEIMDEQRRCVYYWQEIPEEIRESHTDYAAELETVTVLYKDDGETATNLYRIVMDGDVERRYCIRWENKNFIKEYEYVNDDTNRLKVFTHTDKKRKIVYHWEMDGEGPKDTIYGYGCGVVSLTVTKNGNSKTYALREIPWTEVVTPPTYVRE